MLAKAVSNVQSYQRETVPFLGLNRSDDTQEGEFSEQMNMSDRRYPFLAPRLPRKVEKFDTEPSALFSWDGAQIMARDGKLLYDGEALCNVTDGEKQFAVVNTKLVVWPDKVAVDLTDRKVISLAAKAVNNSTATFTQNTLSFLFDVPYATSTLRYRSSDESKPYIYTYSALSWDEENGWTKDGGAWTLPSVVGRFYIPSVTFSESTQTYIVSGPASLFAGSKPNGTPDDEPNNDLGFYVALDKVVAAEATATSYFAEMKTIVYWEQMENQSLDKLFHVGNAVYITGTAYGVHDGEKRIIRAIDPETNTLTFDPGTFLTGDAVCAVTEDLSEITVGMKWTVDGTTKRYQATTITAEAGDFAVIDTSAGVVRVYDEDWIPQGEFAVKAVTSLSGINTVWDMELISTTRRAITVERKIPALDYICERENRLWGLSNADKTIYASALGDPCCFYTYDGLATDSWAVAVGSEGDFTGICDYGNAVLCWKERTLHKVLGDYPSNYQTATYRFSGVRAGAHKSLVNVNETLFFLGVDGVYAYTGNKPSLVSRALGADVLENGVGGTDGKAYYLSAKNGEAWELLSYDTHTGLWARSDETQVVDFCRVGDDVKFLSGDTVYTIGGGDESVEWEAVFVPTYETLEGGKQYNKLIFRVEAPKDGYMAADVRFDDGRWMQVGIVKGKSGPVHMPVPLRRCDKFQIRLRGKGDCAVLDMVREFRLRGDG